MREDVGPEDVGGALESAFAEELRSDGWPVYYRYEIAEEEGETFVVAPLGSGLFARADTDGRFDRPVNPFDPGEDVKKWYAPLRTPELLIDLAYVADDPDGRPITPEAAVRWAKNYGLLAHVLEEDKIDGGWATVSGLGRRGSVAGFARAAREVRACLRLYESLTAGVDLSFEEMWSYTMALPRDIVLGANPLRARLMGEERSAFHDVVGRMTQRRLREHSYPQITTFTRAGRPTGRFGFGYGFHSLLGAVWLQMAWLISADDQPARCKLPTCRRVIDFEPAESSPDPGLQRNPRGSYKTRRDIEFCKDRGCRQKYHYRKKAGWPGYA
jgi:hypothetical protein